MRPRRDFIHSFVAFCLSVVTAGTAWAMTSEDFATGRRLTITDGAALGRYTLPLEVLAAVDGGVSQIAVFNAAGDVVPFAFRVPEAAQPTNLTQLLPLFPIHVTDGAGSGRLTTVDVEMQSDGTLARVRVAEPGKTAPGKEQKRVQRYIVDASVAKGAIDELSFVIRPHAGVDADFTWTVHVAAGNSLDDLTHVTHSGTLARLTHDGTSLNVTSLTTPGLRQPYLAITWDGRAPGVIEQIEAKVASAKVGVALRKTDLVASRLPLSDPVHGNSQAATRFALVYDAQAELPLRSLQLELPQTNSLAKVDVYASSEAPHGSALGSHVFAGSVYRLLHNGAALESSPIAVSRAARYIAVTTQQTASETQLGLNTDNTARWPRLTVTYAPTQLWFVATGESPFTLAYGTYQPSQAVSPTELLSVAVSLNADQTDVDNVTATESFRLGTPTPPREPWPWKRLGLWSVLVLGVAVLGLMTRGLLKR